MNHSYICAMCMSASVIFVSLSNTSCVCQKVAPYFAQTQSLISDAELALTQAKQFMDLAKTIPDKTREEFDIQLAKAYKGLQDASQKLTLATQTCSLINNVTDAFKDYNDAWGVIRTILPLIAATNKEQISARLDTPNTVIVKDPICFSLKKQ